MTLGVSDLQIFLDTQTLAGVNSVGLYITRQLYIYIEREHTESYHLNYISSS